MREIFPVAPYPYTFGRYHEPIARVKPPEETMVLCTEDCFEGKVHSEQSAVKSSR